MNRLQHVCTSLQPDLPAVPSSWTDSGQGLLWDQAYAAFRVVLGMRAVYFPASSGKAILKTHRMAVHDLDKARTVGTKTSHLKHLTPEGAVRLLAIEFALAL